MKKTMVKEMENKKILTVAFSAILAISIIPSSLLQNAYAQTPLNYVTGFTSDIIEVGYSNGKIWALSTNGTIPTAKAYLFEVNATTLTIDNQYNVTATISDGITSVGGQPTDLWCSPIYCYYSTVRTTGSSGTLIQVATITSGGETKGDIVTGIDVSNTLTGSNVKIDGLFQTSGSVTQIFWSSKSASTTGIMARIDGLAMTLNQQVSTAPLATDIIGDIGFFSSTGTEWHAFSGLTVGGSTITGRTWDILDNTLDCSIAASGTSTQGFANFANYLGTSTNPYLGQTPSIDSPNYGTVQRIPYMPYTNGTAVAFFEMDDSGSCSILSGDNYLMSDLDLANVQVRTAQFDERDSLFFLQEGGSNARISVVSYDGITGTISGTPVVYETNPAVSQSPINGEFVIIPDLELIIVPETGIGRRIVVLDYSSLAPSTPEETGGVDCAIPANANLLICRLVAQTGGNIGGLGGIIDTGIFSVFVNAGLISGTDTNPQTNGVGYFITGVGLAIMTAVFWIASRGKLTDIPTFIWVIGTLTLLGTMTAIGWIDATFFIISIIAIVALAVAKLKGSVFSDDFGSGIFKGE